MPETGILYVASLTNHDALALTVADPKRSDMGYVGGGGGRGGRGGPAGPNVIRRRPTMAKGAADPANEQRSARACR